MFKKLGILILAGLLVVMPVTAFSKVQSATFAWDQVITADFAGWTLYMSTTQGGPYAVFSEIGYNPEVTEYTSTQSVTSPDGVEATYYFVMTARDTNGNVSVYSTEVMLTVDAIAPNVPQNLTVTIIIE